MRRVLFFLLISATLIIFSGTATGTDTGFYPVDWIRPGMIGKISIDINLPGDFPGKYRKAVIAAADHCAVKKHVLKAPEFDVRANIG